MSTVALFANASTPIDVDSLTAAIGADVALVTPSATCMRIPMDRAAEDCVIEVVRDAEAIFFRVGEVTSRIIGAARRLRVIAVHGIGTDSVDVEAASAHKVYVTITPGGNAIAVAEYVMSALLTAMRRLDSSMNLFRSTGWDAARLPGRELHGKVLGVVGYGGVGARVAALGAAFGMEVVVADHPSVKDCPFPRRSLPELATFVDALVVSVPRRPSTIGMISEPILRSMKEAASLVNISRADIVDEDALLRALDDGVIASAALDVFSREPTASDHPLVAHPKVLPTPHMAGSTLESLARIASIAGEDIRRVLDGAPPMHAINRF